MSEPFIAEIRIFAGNFNPRGWAFCNGALLPISQNTALFSLIGTTYGGDGRSTTALPNLINRMPMHPGRGPGLSSKILGQRTGVETVTLQESQIPNHTHSVTANGGNANVPEAESNELAEGPELYSTEMTNGQTMHQSTVPDHGGSQAHNNQSPYLNLSFIIALVGVYPSRS